MIDSLYDTIAAGDEVGVADGHKNYIQGRVHLISDGGVMAVEAFGHLIPFAHRNKNKTWVATSGVRLVDHQPPLLAMT